ncbi:hypothetical protein METBIDRAFT_89897 [Metschnikowia bicuspidata var. bicuspidata NRRL YB-4993]|uniref:Uncharacterized protein n=1 Tax=Metschnikowia bicuspidata var. bicuspidata NRRL YB-4993 TaxID=869754 RepID=A0A1A0HFC2_9ASCO|nr:hypothetical protein METBIDRAFT_89897 [Metschnikowia bicuspidata var. bicuspidata NRRL YB-4993]OBA22680.1 hypothetical protein METBIDRAFT_89897 [Metschnikowia bicuspidata var. bicuspidata NRRL YB-4993]
MEGGDRSGILPGAGSRGAIEDGSLDARWWLGSHSSALARCVSNCGSHVSGSRLRRKPGRVWWLWGRGRFRSTELNSLLKRFGDTHYHLAQAQLHTSCPCSASYILHAQLHTSCPCSAVESEGPRVIFHTRLIVKKHKHHGRIAGEEQTRDT